MDGNANPTSTPPFERKAVTTSSHSHPDCLETPSVKEQSEQSHQYMLVQHGSRLAGSIIVHIQ
jgi:hypothetical protein